MKQIHVLHRKVLACVSTMLLAASPCSAALLATELSVQVASQATSSSGMELCTVLVSATVVEPGAEFPNLGSYGSSCAGLFIVNVDINAGDDFLEIGFTNAGSGGFANRFFNGYIFTFESDAGIIFESATVDTSLTTLGLTDSSLQFLGNQLFVNVAGLGYNPSSFARISVTAVPVPATAWLVATGIGLLALRTNRCRSLISRRYMRKMP